MPGLSGTHYLSIVDIDEAGFYTSACERKWGYAIKGRPARSAGLSKRSLLPNLICSDYTDLGDVFYTVLIAVDARQGVVSSLFYGKARLKRNYFSVLYFLP